MTRNLAMIAGAGLLLCVVCLAGAVALGGRDALEHHWGRHWSIGWDDGAGAFGPHNLDSSEAGGDQRVIAWSGADALDLEAPADVVYTQAPGPGRLVISGSRAALDRLVLDGSRLAYRDGGDFEVGRLKVVMTAPDVRRFSIDGDGRIRINSYAQDDLTLDVSGHGDITGAGQARDVRVDVSGAGDVDLADLKAQSAYAEISGFGRVKVAPASSADLHISGAGEIDLVTRPPRVVSDVSGAGRIVEAGGGTTSPPG